MRTVTIDRDYYFKKHEMYDWCSTRFAEGSWDVWNAFGYLKYTFNNDEDYSLFMLTWCDYATDI